MKNLTGKVVLITGGAAGIGGLVGFPNGTPYSASKGGISNMTRTAAIEYGKYGIRVNAVAPTAVLSGQGQRFIDASPDPKATLAFLKTMNPLAGIPSAEDVAASAAFLASDDARFISGVVLPVDGGYTAA